MDDLISRKSLINNLNQFAPEHYTMKFCGNCGAKMEGKVSE